MNSVAEIIRKIRGELNYVQLAARTDMSRQTLMAIEAGVPTKLSTLRQIARSCDVQDDQWDELLVAWVAEELGAGDFARLNERLSPKLAKPGESERLLLTTYKRLSEAERLAIIQTVLNKPVRTMLPGLVQLYLMNGKPGASGEFPKNYLRPLRRPFQRPGKQM